MSLSARHDLSHSREVGDFADYWGGDDAKALYLDRCQVDTPRPLVLKVWSLILKRRTNPGMVVDFGAGDGRFAEHGRYKEYIGFEIDDNRKAAKALPKGATLKHQCAFTEEIVDADVSIGNPPYVRNQDLPVGWRERVSQSLFRRSGVALSGLSNAWQYFFLLSLLSTNSDGLVALVVPYEWVSRPSVHALRNYIKAQQWNVDVYRLMDTTFDRVLTTSSITIIDKSSKNGVWKFFEENSNGTFRPLSSESGSHLGVIDYAKKRQYRSFKWYARRGLSPGTQEVLTLTEGERVRAGLRIEADVVPCVTSLRTVSPAEESLTRTNFNRFFRDTGRKCWLIRTDRKPSSRLQGYLDGIPLAQRETATCLERKDWWAFPMPEAPRLLAATGFHGKYPKIVMNGVGARAVGGVCGIYGVPKSKGSAIIEAFKSADFSRRVVSHSHGLKKIEIGQFNTVLNSLAGRVQG